MNVNNKLNKLVGCGGSQVHSVTHNLQVVKRESEHKSHTVKRHQLLVSGSSVSYSSVVTKLQGDGVKLYS